MCMWDGGDEVCTYAMYMCVLEQICSKKTPDFSHELCSQSALSSSLVYLNETQRNTTRPPVMRLVICTTCTYITHTHSHHSTADVHVALAKICVGGTL